MTQNSILQMQHSVPDLLCPSLIPELCSNISAGSSGYEHLILIFVSAIRALPDQFAGLIIFDDHFPVITAAFAVIALCI